VSENVQDETASRPAWQYLSLPAGTAKAEENGVYRRYQWTARFDRTSINFNRLK